MTEFNENNTENKEKQNASASFQDELRRNLRTVEEIKKEQEEIKRRQEEENRRQKIEQKEKFDRMFKTCFAEAKETFERIKEQLVLNARNVRYAENSETVTISCVCKVSQRFINVTIVDNREEMVKQQNKILVIREKKYRQWFSFAISRSMSEEYDVFSYILRKFAEKENIRIKFVACQNNVIYPFPGISEYNNYKAEFPVELCVSATTVVEMSSTASEPDNLLHNKEVKYDEIAISEFKRDYLILLKKTKETDRIRGKISIICLLYIIVLGFSVDCIFSCDKMSYSCVKSLSSFLEFTLIAAGVVLIFNLMWIAIENKQNKSGR